MKDFNKYFIVGTNSDALHDTMNGMVVGELIRCKDCKHYTGYECQRSKVSNIRVITNDDDYCSRAERKESS